VECVGRLAWCLACVPWWGWGDTAIVHPCVCVGLGQTDLLDTVREERDRNRTVTARLTDTEFALASVRSDLEAANVALAAREERLRALNTEVSLNDVVRRGMGRRPPGFECSPRWGPCRHSLTYHWVHHVIMCA
jgi:hypothetical protein